jgi:hypothetical protein
MLPAMKVYPLRPRPIAPALLLGALLAATLLGACGSVQTRKVIVKGEASPLPRISESGPAGRITRNTARLGASDPVTDAAAVASAVHPGLTPSSRPQAVVFASTSAFPIALAAAALASAPLGAPLLYSEAGGVPAVSVAALEAMKPTGAPVLGGAKVIRVGGAAVPSGYASRALPATEPFSAAVEIERLAEGIRGAPPRQVLVVNSEAPAAFAMPAAGLAAESGAPILLVSSAAVPAPTRALLAGLGRPAIYAIGPSSAIGEAVVKELERFGPVKRISGSSAAENAVALARFSEGSFGWGVHEPGHGLVFANASRPLDAPAAAPLSASGDFAPLLLLESASAIPPVLSRYLEDIQAAYSAQVPPVRALYNHGWIIGDESAITAATQAELDAKLEVAPRTSAPTPTFVP